MDLYPITLNLQGRHCVVVGGGHVAWRKVRGIYKAGARVVIISPELVPELAELVEDGKIVWRERYFQSGDLAGAALVFAATNSPAAQELVQQEAVAMGILANIADDPAKSGFHVPGYFRKGDILVSVSTGGKSPAMTSMLRQFLEQQIDTNYVQAVSFFGFLRKKVLALDSNSQAHGQLFKELLESGIVAKILNDDWQGVVQELNRLPSQSFDANNLVREFLEKNSQ